ncbi:MAG: hypothetical protein U0872_12480 [Planctomycetaceae bacterium]
MRTFLVCLACLFTAAAGRAQETGLTSEKVEIRGQSPFLNLPQSLPAETGPLLSMQTADSNWILLNQSALQPVHPYASSSTMVAQADPTMPYGQPMYQDPGLSGLFMEMPAVWQPYVAAQGLFGNKDTLGMGQLMMPLYQDGQSLVFADIRGRWDDQSNSEGNFGLALRKMIDPSWFIGTYGFYDYRRTSNGNSFNQGSVGIEAMSVRYEARMNGYIPDSSAKHANDLSTTSFTGTTVFVNGGFERAYYGLDGEVGALFWEEWGGNLELRGFVGGYWFDTGGTNFPSIAGPKGRLELRLYDLPCFGPQSRLTLGVEMQDDNVRDFQVAGLARLEIPLGIFGGTRSLTRLERRMLDRIVRDNDIVTQARQDSHEVGIDSATGRMLNNVTVVNPATADVQGTIAAATNPNSTVIMNGDVNGVSQHYTIDGVGANKSLIVNPNQVLRGGGFLVIGSQTGAQAVYGTRPTIDNTTTTFDTIRLVSDTGVAANQAQIVGLNLTGGRNGISSYGGSANPALQTLQNVQGVFISGNNVSGAHNAGFAFAFVNNDTGTRVTNNVADSNGRNANGDPIDGTATGVGFQLGAPAGSAFAGTATGNQASNNLGTGYQFPAGISGNVSGNTATNNGRKSDGTIDNPAARGFDVGGPMTGAVSNNSSTDNANDGFRFQNSLSGAGKVTGNSAARNGLDANGNSPNGSTVHGFNFGAPVGVAVSGNSATNNAGTGLFFNSVVTNTVSGNTSSNNGRNSDGTIGNTGAAGYLFADVFSGSFSGNSAISNGGTGVQFNSVVVGSNGVTNNTSTGNGRNADGSFSLDTAHGFNFVGGVTAPVTGNSSSNNAGTGFRFNNIVTGLVANNTASGNGRNTTGNPDSTTAAGFLFGNNVTGSVFHNFATNNANDGFYFVNTGNTMSGKVGDGTAANQNTASSNGGYGFRFEQKVEANGSVKGNAASNNFNGGMFFNSIGVGSAGTVSNNTATSNGIVGAGNSNANGFSLGTIGANGLVSNNTAFGNANNGFARDDGVANDARFANAGKFNTNFALQNRGDGFVFDTTGASSFNGNTATSNLGAGYNGIPASAAGTANNTGSGNGSNNTYKFP